tara:strand:+ start:532 stop:720 length:189 start_codon:yes stop_codon:yes gene_type:complete
MEEIVDLIVTDSSPNDISDKIKDVLLAKSAERIEAERSAVGASMFDDSEVDEVEPEETPEEE